MYYDTRKRYHDDWQDKQSIVFVSTTVRVAEQFQCLVRKFGRVLKVKKSKVTEEKKKLIEVAREVMMRGDIIDVLSSLCQ